MEPPHRDENVTAMPGISPGTVKDDEEVLRSLFNPEHVENGVLQERAISLDDLRCRGYSVHRLRHTDRQTVQRSNEKILGRSFNGQSRTLVGAAILRAREVRDLRHEGKQAFVVIDTALKCNRGHSSIYAKDSPFSKGRLRKLRELLLPLVDAGMTANDPFTD
jgi:hypothetical protein